MKKRSILILTLVISMAVCLSACQTVNEKPESSEVFLFDTYVSQTAYGKDRVEAIKKVESEIKRVENELSMYIEDSLISEINKNAGVSPVKVNDYTFNLIKTAVEYSRYSEGTFDISVAPLVELWGVTGDNPRVPSEKEINDALKLINYEKIILEEANKTVFLSETGMSIDLGGIAKGYICTMIKDIYDSYDIASALISLGGNIYAYNNKPNGAPYNVGIRDPLGGANDIVGTLKACDVVIATTGSYERNFVKDNITYHHILDLNTGYPVNSDFLSITVVSPNGGLADFLSTAIYASGIEQLNSLLNQEEFSLIAITKDKKIYISDDISDSFEILNKDYSIMPI